MHANSAWPVGYYSFSWNFLPLWPLAYSSMMAIITLLYLFIYLWSDLPNSEIKQSRGRPYLNPVCVSLFLAQSLIRHLASSGQGQNSEEHKHQRGESGDRTYHVRPQEGVLRSYQRARAAGEEWASRLPAQITFQDVSPGKPRAEKIVFSGQMS